MQTVGYTQTIPGGEMLAKQCAPTQAPCGEITALSQQVEKDIAVISVKVDELEQASYAVLLPNAPANPSKEETGVAGSAVGATLLEFHRQLTGISARLTSLRERIAI